MGEQGESVFSRLGKRRPIEIGNPESQSIQTGFNVFSEEQEVKRKTRAQRFGVDTMAVAEAERQFGDSNVEGHDRKLEWGPEIDRRLNVIHIYGTDHMDTKAVLNYFREYGPTGVEWVNVSSCNVAFVDDFTASRALLAKSQPLEKPKEEEGQDAEMADTNPDADAPAREVSECIAGEGEGGGDSEVRYSWRQGEDYVVNGVSHPALLRYATVEDIRPPDATSWGSFQKKQRQQNRKRKQRVRERKRRKKSGEGIAIGGVDPAPVSAPEPQAETPDSPLAPPRRVEKSNAEDSMEDSS